MLRPVPRVARDFAAAPARALALSLVLAMPVVAMAPAVAVAKECASEAVSAGGERAAFRWLALTKARANWRARVRRTPGLGPAYAGWRNAEGLVERCISASGGVACEMSAVPCKP